MKRMEWFLEKGRKKLLILLAAALVIGGTGGSLFFLQRKDNDTSQQGRQMLGNREGMVTATGTTYTGMVTEEYELTGLENQLYIEEVYLHQGDEVEEGTAILRFSEESLEAVKKELEQEAQAADYSYLLKEIEARQELIDARAQLDKAEAEKTYAQIHYETTLVTLGQETASLEKQISETQEEIDELTYAIETGYQEAYDKMMESWNVYSENFTLLMKLYEEWHINDISLSSTSGASGGQSISSGQSVSIANQQSTTGIQNTATGGQGEASQLQNGTAGAQEGTSQSQNETAGTQGGTSQSQSGSTGGQSSTAGGTRSGSQSSTYDEASSKKEVYDELDEEVQEMAAEYKQAKADYEELTTLSSANLARASSELADLQLQLEKAKIQKESQEITAKLEYDQAMAEYEKAQEVYETEVDWIEEELQSSEDARDEAEENLSYFNTYLAKGYFYTSKAGSVMMVMAREGEYLTEGSFIMAYTDAQSLTVSVSVDETDIAKLSVGEEATVMMEDGGSYQGQVISINPISQSTSRSSVYYSVTVSLQGDISGLKENMTATVIFGEIAGSMQNLSPQGDGAGTVSGGEMGPGLPEGAEGRGNGGLPEGAGDRGTEGLPEGAGDRETEGQSDGQPTEGKMEAQQEE